MEDKIINLELPLSELNKLFAVLGEQKIQCEQKYNQVSSLINLVQKQSLSQINPSSVEPNDEI